MKVGFSIAVLAASLAATAPAFARAKISVEAAELVCLERAQKFAVSVYGADGDYPQPNQVKDRYRACVWAKSGQYPSGKLEVRGTKVSIAGGS